MLPGMYVFARLSVSNFRDVSTINLGCWVSVHSLIKHLNKQYIIISAFVELYRVLFFWCSLVRKAEEVIPRATSTVPGRETKEIPRDTGQKTSMYR